MSAIKKLSNAVGLVRGTIQLDDDTTVEGQFGPGAKFVAGDGREFAYVQASAAITAGQVVQVTDVLTYLVNQDVDAASAIGSDLITGTAGDFTLGQDEGAVIYLDAGTGAGQMRIIKEVVSSATVRVSEPLTVAIDATTDFVVFRPAVVEPHAAAATAAAGVAQVAIAADSYGWIQTRGLGVVNVDGSQDPIVANRLVTVGVAVAGTAEGPTAAGITAVDLECKVGIGVVDVGALDITAPIYIDCNML